jgi:hypothetical protein
MAQNYDKIFKENIEEIILPLARKLLNIHPEELEEIPDDLQVTIERRPDFLKKVREKGKEYVLHIEFQLEDNHDMTHRMLEYYAILFRKYKMEVRQYVFYINQKPPTIPTSIHYTQLDYSFKLVNLQGIDYQTFLQSNKPEEIILAILGDFKNEPSSKVIVEILTQLKTITTATSSSGKYVIQLEVLSKLRSLQSPIYPKTLTPEANGIALKLLFMLN